MIGTARDLGLQQRYSVSAAFLSEEKGVRACDDVRVGRIG
jgi:hypothetical protein